MIEQDASILVVEDETNIRTALTDFLEFHGFEVTEAAEPLQIAPWPRGGLMSFCSTSC